MAIWARDEAVRAKEEAKFARTEAACSKEKAEEEAYDARVVETEAALKAQVPGVCRLYCSQVWNEALKRAGVDASSDLWKAEFVFYPPAIREDATPSSEVRDARLRSPALVPPRKQSPPKCSLKGVVLLGRRGPMRVRILLGPSRLRGL